MRGTGYVWIWLVFVWAGQAAAVDVPGGAFSMSGLLGMVTVNGSQWQRMDLQPRIRSGPFEAVLDLELFVDAEGRFRDLGWDFSSRRKGLESVLRKIHYIRYGKPNDRRHRVYLRVGDLDVVTLGQGMIMRRYRNTLDAPGVKKTGLDLQIQGLSGGRVMARGVVSSFLDWDGGGPVVGGRIAYRTRVGLELGATVAADLDQLSALPDSVRAGAGRDRYGIFGVDAVYPLMQGPVARVSFYGGVSRTAMTGQAGTGLNGPGVLVTAGGLRVQVEYRWVEGRFRPGYFNALYDLNRAAVDPGTGAIVPRESTVADLSMQGVFGDAELSLGPLLKASASYQHLTGDGNEDRRLEGRASLMPALLKRLHKVAMAEAYYEHWLRGPKGFDFFEPTLDTRYGYRVGFDAVSKVSIVWEVEYTYRPDGAGGVKRQRIFNLQSLINL